MKNSQFSIKRFSFLSLKFNLAQFIVELINFTMVLLFSIILLLFVQSEKFFHSHVYVCCLSIWFLLTFFTVTPIILQQYTSVIRFMGLITFLIITIHTTFPIGRYWTLLMSSTSSILHGLLVLRSHDIRDQLDKSQRMEFKLEVYHDVDILINWNNS